MTLLLPHMSGVRLMVMTHTGQTSTVRAEQYHRHTFHPRHCPRQADYKNVPTVVFSHPPIATCGMTEPEARKEYGEDNLRVYMSKFTNLFYGHWEVR